MPEVDQHTIGPEDEKIVALARAARARISADEGAAVRDTGGRTYAAATVDLPSFKITAIQAAVAAAVSSGAEGLEAATVVCAESTVRDVCVRVVRDLAPNAPILRADLAGIVCEVVR